MGVAEILCAAAIQTFRSVQLFGGVASGCSPSHAFHPVEVAVSASELAAAAEPICSSSTLPCKLSSSSGDTRLRLQ